MTFPAPLKSF